MTYGVAIVGAGIGAQHLQGYLELPERFHIATVCDLNHAKAEALAGPHGIQTTEELDAVLNDDAVDIVDICLPPHLHLSACVSALQAGKHVVCEKPLVTSLADADQIIAEVDRSGNQVFPVFQYRYGMGTAQLRALMDAGLAGACYAGSLETHWDRDADYYAIDWRGTWSGEQGGALLGHAIHIHDLLTSILGPVGQVFADTTTRVNPVEVEDCAALAVRMASGATVTSSVTLGAAGNTSRLRLLFEGFTVESDNEPYAPAAQAWRFSARAPVTQIQIDAVLATVQTPRVGYAGLFEAIADALDGKPGKEVTLEDGRRSLEFVTACYASSRQNLPVTLPLTKDHNLYDGWQP